MSEEISIHDNFVVSYTVECQEQQITIRTIFRDEELQEHTDIIFSGVTAYHFERDNFGTILADIMEVSPDQVYTDYKDIFERSKNYGWPAIPYSTEADLLETLNSQGIKGFLIWSSYGMNGFVLAQEMRMVPSGR